MRVDILVNLAYRPHWKENKQGVFTAKIVCISSTTGARMLMHRVSILVVHVRLPVARSWCLPAGAVDSVRRVRRIVGRCRHRGRDTWRVSRIDVARQITGLGVRTLKLVVVYIEGLSGFGRESQPSQYESRPGAAGVLTRRGVMVSGTPFVRWRILETNDPWIGGGATMNSMSFISRVEFLMATARVGIGVCWRGSCPRSAPENGTKRVDGPSYFGHSAVLHRGCARGPMHTLSRGAKLRSLAPHFPVGPERWTGGRRHRWERRR